MKNWRTLNYQGNTAISRLAAVFEVGPLLRHHSRSQTSRSKCWRAEKGCPVHICTLLCDVRMASLTDMQAWAATLTRRWLTHSTTSGRQFKSAERQRPKNLCGPIRRIGSQQAKSGIEFKANFFAYFRNVKFRIISSSNTLICRTAGSTSNDWLQ